MQQALLPEPVRVLLNCRYSNGRTITYGARALAYDDSSLRVLSAEGFEKGTLLTVVAPFLKGARPCRVVGTTRNPERPGYVELDLNFLAKTAAPVVQAERAGDESPPQRNLDALASAAAEMAAQLETGHTLRFSEVLEKIAPERRPIASAVSAIAVVLLLREKIALDLPRLVEAVKAEIRPAASSPNSGNL